MFVQCEKYSHFFLLLNWRVGYTKQEIKMIFGIKDEFVKIGEEVTINTILYMYMYDLYK